MGDYYAWPFSKYMRKKYLDGMGSVELCSAEIYERCPECKKSRLMGSHPAEMGTCRKCGYIG